jgi:D-amino-acid dehydrogenase
MDVIVIGGGIAGMASAYELRRAGHSVCVIERRATVAQGASFGHGGGLLPTPLDAWFGPGLTGLRWRARWSARLGRPGSLGYRPGLGGSVTGFARRLRRAEDTEIFAARYRALQPLVDFSREVIEEIETANGLEFEQRHGVLYLLRTTRDLRHAQAALALLDELEIEHLALSGPDCAALEPSLPLHQPLARGVLLRTARSANCPQFAKLLKQLLEQDGVRFEMGRAVQALRCDTRGASVELAAPASGSTPGARVTSLTADVIVLAAGTGSLALLPQPLRALVHPLRMHALSAPLGPEERAPHITLVDTAQRITITRFANRIRIAGAALLQGSRQSQQSADPALRHAALTRLGQAAHDWIPGAAKLAAATTWDDTRLLSSDGLPVAGATLQPRLFVNLAHGPGGWALACGSARVVAQSISGDTSDLPAATLAAISPARLHG